MDNLPAFASAKVSQGRIGWGSMRRAIALFLLVLVIVAGCGGGGDDDDSTESVTVGATGTAAPLTKAEYIEQADGICRSYNEQLGPLRAEVQTQIRLRDFAAAADTVGEAVEVTRTGVEELEALPKPAGDEAVLDHLEDLRQQTVALLARTEDAIRDEDVGRTNSIIREGESVEERRDAIATGYGFQDCGQGD
jgi:hypothetical protein